MKYLFLSAHTDDVELSCGGTMAKLAEQGHKVQILFLSNCGQLELSDNAYQASLILGVYVWGWNFDVRTFRNDANTIGNEFYKIAQEGGHDFIFTHSDKCKHPDHLTVGEESKRVFTTNFITYIHPWNGNENPNYFVELSEEHLGKKIQALSCYKSQSHRSYMNPDFIRSQAIYNGIKCGKKYAEAFRIEKLIA